MLNRITCLIGAAVFFSTVSSGAGEPGGSTGLSTEAEVARLGAEVRPKGWIIYSAVANGGDWDLFLSRPDGSGRKAVTATPEHNEAGGRFSPDGKQLLYYRMPKCVPVGNNTYGTQELVIADADGSRPVILGDAFPWASWGPGGGRIACLVPGGIQIVDVETCKVIRRIPRKGMFQQLSWSPDGKAFIGTVNGLGPAWNIGRLDAESGEMKALSEVERYNCTPDWFPDSRRAIYSRGIVPGKDGRAELWAADGDGSRRTPVYAEEDRHIYGGCVSPDGRHVIFTRSEGDLGDPRKEIAMALIRLADAPIAVGVGRAWLDAHADSSRGPRLDLGMGWEPDWTFSEAPAGAPPAWSRGPTKGKER